jgi:hypothetical protein
MILSILSAGGLGIEWMGSDRIVTFLGAWLLWDGKW